MENKETLKNYILHEIRNANLLTLKAEIITSIFQGKEVENIENPNKMKNQNIKTALFFTILLTAIVTIHLLTPTQYR
jgi:hypothetical protein